jgi:hypothetical protein
MRTLSFLLCASALWAAPALAEPAHYVVVAGVSEAEGVTSGIRKEAEKLFVDELKRHPELTLDRPEGLPEAPAEMAAELKKRKMDALELTLKILSIHRHLKPAAAGKQYPMLERGIRLSVFGNKLPEKVMAIGGDGESNAGVEVGKQADLEREGKALLLDCTKEALRQAVEMTLNKLKPLPTVGGKKKRPRKT